ncbi:unnamed protein product, partial [Vitis vinifera]
MKIPFLDLANSIPRKYIRGPKSFLSNSRVKVFFNLSSSRFSSPGDSSEKIDCLSFLSSRGKYDLEFEQLFQIQYQEVPLVEPQYPRAY